MLDKVSIPGALCGVGGEDDGNGVRCMESQGDGPMDGLVAVNVSCRCLLMAGAVFSRDPGGGRGGKNAVVYPAVLDTVGIKDEWRRCSSMVR